MSFLSLCGNAPLCIIAALVRVFVLLRGRRGKAESEDKAQSSKLKGERQRAKVEGERFTV